ncbi:MAG: hypothetical protein M3336_00480 [Chloroflexota bacterium]|nr:hypothetical protein [Chloroflexota bacterium]
MSDDGLKLAHRLIWVLCSLVYLTVYVGGLLGGGSDLGTMLRAMGFTLATAIVGKLVLVVLGRASEPLSANADGTVGSRIDLVSSANISHPEIEADLT